MAAAICLDPQNSIIAATTGILPSISDPFIAEASAAYLVAKLASSMAANFQFRSVALEGDSSIVAASSST